MQNYNDILNGVTDGTKDITVNALTCNGTVSLKGNTTIGDASSDDLTVTASLASTISIKTTNTYNIGSATLGLAGAYFGTASTTTARIVAAAHASSRTYTLPDAGAAADFVMTAAAQTIGGLKAFSTGITMAVAGGAASTLADYETATLSYANVTDWTASQTATIYLVRVGNLITISMPATITGTSNSTNVVLMDSTGFLSRWRPARDQLTLAGGADASTDTPVKVRVRSSGTMDALKGYSGGNFTNSATTKSVYAFTFSYLLN